MSCMLFDVETWGRIAAVAILHRAGNRRPGASFADAIASVAADMGLAAAANAREYVATYQGRHGPATVPAEREIREAAGRAIFDVPNDPDRLREWLAPAWSREVSLVEYNCMAAGERERESDAICRIENALRGTVLEAMKARMG